MLFAAGCISNVKPTEVEIIKVPEFSNFYADNALYGFDGKRIFFEKASGIGTYNISYLHEDSTNIVEIPGVSFVPNDISFEDSVLIGHTYLPEGYIVKYNFNSNTYTELTGTNTSNNKYNGYGGGRNSFYDSTKTKIYYTMLTNMLLNNIRGIVQMDSDGRNWEEILRDGNNQGPVDAKYNRYYDKILDIDFIEYPNEKPDVVINISTKNFEKIVEYNLTDILEKSEIKTGYPIGYDFYDSSSLLVLLSTYELYLINLEIQKAETFILLDQEYYIKELPKRHPTKPNTFLVTIATRATTSIFEFDYTTKTLTNIFSRL